MWTYLLGPLLALLPKRWRAQAPFADSVKWRRAAFLSGALEVIAALAALVVWYSYSVTHHTPTEIALALRAHPDVQIDRPQLLGLVGFTFVALNPVTWLIGWFGFEGVVRALAAAITGETVGTLPLWLADRGYCTVSKWRESRRMPLVPDEVSWAAEGDREVLRVKSCRQKPNWQNRPTIRYKGEFFRVVKAVQASGTRPYVYDLRRLEPGEIIRGLEDYEPELPNK